MASPKGLTAKPDLVEEQQTAQCKLRAAVFNAISETDVSDVVKQIVTRAKDGDQVALKYLFDYILGGRVTTAVQNNYFVDGTGTPSPTDALPGSDNKVEVMRDRVARGERIFSEADAQADQETEG